jgi:hypothetical protein
VAGSCVHVSEPSDFIKGRDIFWLPENLSASQRRALLHVVSKLVKLVKVS